MKGYVSSGDTITAAAPYDVASGAGAKIGQLFGVAVNDVASGAIGVFKTIGVHKLAKVGSQAWTVGALVYWDNTNKRFTTTASGNLLAGCAAEAAGSGAGETVGRVRLNGIAQPDAS